MQRMVVLVISETAVNATSVLENFFLEKKSSIIFAKRVSISKNLRAIKKCWLRLIMWEKLRLNKLC